MRRIESSTGDGDGYLAGDTVFPDSFIRVRVVIKDLENFVLSDFLPVVRSFSLSLTTCLAVVCSCSLWIGGITWVVVALLGLSATTAWLIAGGLGAVAVAAIGILAYEVRHAIELPDDVDLELVELSLLEPLVSKLPAGRSRPVHVRS